MKRQKKLALGIIGVILALGLLWGVLQWYLWKTPLITMNPNAPGGALFDRRTAAGRAFASVNECSEHQKYLYECIEAYVEKHGEVPPDMNTLINDVHETRAFRNCPTTKTRYDVHFENYGKANAVLIEAHENKHPTALALWIRGFKPEVKTMGDGKIHLFADGKLATKTVKMD